MSEKMLAYARSNDTGTRAAPKKKISRRTTVKAPSPAPVKGKLVLNEQQFEAFFTCMMTPAEPTANARAGAQLLDRLPTPRR